MGSAIEDVTHRLSKRTGDLDHFGRAEIRDHKAQIIPCLKANDTHALQSCVIEINATGSPGHEESAHRQPFTLPSGEDHRENRSSPPRDEVDILPRTARDGADMGFENLKSRELCRDHW